MVCPSCGAQTEGQGKFCATCGAHLPEAAAPPPPNESAPPPAPPAWSAAPPPPPPPPAPYGAPQYGAPPPAPYGAPQYGAPQYGAPQYGAPQYAPIAASRAATGTPIGALLALAGGAVAIASAWLPWATASSATLGTAMDATDTSTLACGYYLLIGGGIAAACGLLLLLRVASPGLPMLLGLGAIAGGALAVAVEVVAYGKLNDSIGSYGSSFGIAIGYGVYVGIGAGAVAAVGGLLSLGNRR